MIPIQFSTTTTDVEAGDVGVTIEDTDKQCPAINDILNGIDSDPCEVSRLVQLRVGIISLNNNPIIVIQLARFSCFVSLDN